MSNTAPRRDAAGLTSPSVSICFPVYNEASTIRDVLVEAHSLLSKSALEYEIIVCDDGSSDDTAAIIQDVTAQVAGLRVLHHPRNLGIHATFEHLQATATKEFVFLNATDRQWRTAVLFDLLPLTREADIIVASRIDKHYGVWRRFISWVFNRVPAVLFGVRTIDAGAIKLVRREIIQRFPLVSRSPFSEAERLIRASRAGYRIRQFPVETDVRRAGRAAGIRFSVLCSAMMDVPRVWWSLQKEKSRTTAVRRP